LIDITFTYSYKLTQSTQRYKQVNAVTMVDTCLVLRITTHKRGKI